ncbi:MAG: hypothetical protein JWN39_2924 [Ilumatobacteraceae bacterium]|nr:hypothetical protein [Ilumatobacteraceae bacterium]MCU1398270.1 hypothetical protein [Acidimicrobiales bacterium]
MVLGSGRQGRHVLERGQLVGGRLVGIERITLRSSDEHGGTNTYHRFQYAVEVHAAQPYVAGVRQTLNPDQFVRLGMELAVRDDHGLAVIDWAATGGGTTDDIKLLRKPPPNGVNDDDDDLDKARRKWSPASCTITGIGMTEGLFHTRGLDADLRVNAPTENGGQPFGVHLKSFGAPGYGSHLAAPGATLPCWVKPGHVDHVLIDWPAAAMALPGIGMPPSQYIAAVTRRA